MKKLSLLVSGLVLSTAVLAQKPAAADAAMSLEGQFGWAASTLSFSNQTPSNVDATLGTAGLRFRYFVSDNLAVRVSLGMANRSTMKNSFENEMDNTGDAGTFETKSSLTNIGVGAEYHFAGTDRLSPYGGLDINIASGKYTETGTHADNIGWVAADYSESFEGKSSGFGVNLVAGTDYYFAENFYTGLELGLGWNKVSVTGSTSTNTTGTITNTTKGNDQSWSTFGNNVVGTFRLGWRF